MNWNKYPEKAIEINGVAVGDAMQGELKGKKGTLFFHKFSNVSFFISNEDAKEYSDRFKFEK